MISRVFISCQPIQPDTKNNAGQRKGVVNKDYDKFERTAKKEKASKKEN